LKNEKRKKTKKTKKSEKHFCGALMARTKQTARRCTPSHDDVAAALVVASVPMTHALAPPTPALSAQRSMFALEWVSTTYGCHFFHVPVDWQSLGLTDYPAKIAPAGISWQAIKLAGD
jgi:hypothetical protein